MRRPGLIPFVQRAPIVAFLKDLHGRYAMVNSAWAEVMGVAVDEAVGRRPDEVLPAQLARRFAELDQRVAHSGDDLDTVEHLSVGGTSRSFLARRFPVLDDDGFLVGVGGIAIDITERVENEEALAQAQRRLRDLLDHTPEAYVVFDVDLGRCVEANDNAARLFGLPLETLLMLAPEDLSPPRQPDGRDSRTASRELVERALAGERVVADWMHCTPDGEPRPTRMWLARLNTGGGRQVRGSFVDRRGELEARSQLERQKHFLEETQAIARIGGWEIDLASGAGTWTDGALRVLGWSAGTGGDVLPELLDRLLVDSRQALAAAVAGVRERGEPFDLEVELTAEHRGRVLRLMAEPVVDSASTTRAVGIVQDVTERRVLEARVRQAERLEGLGRLAGGVAHDFNNLLTVILGAAQSLEARGDATMDEELSDLRLAALRAQELTKQLLAFARQERTRAVAVEPVEIIETAARLAGRLMPEGVSLELDLAARPCSVVIDPAQLHQVVFNLVLNARDAVDRGGRIRLTACDAELDGGPAIELRVADNGSGIPEDIQHRVLDPFFTTKGPGKGTGLGLSTAYGVVQQAGGLLVVDSTEGVGTTITVVLPSSKGARAPVGEAAADVGAPGPDVGAFDEEDTWPPSEPLARTEPSGQGLTVLLVDDDHAVRRLTRRVLSRAGFTVHDARDGHEALALAKILAGDIDLLLSDMVMPEMSGLDVAEAFKAICPNVPVLFVSGYAEEALAERGLAAEAVDMVSKPFSAAQLVARVHATITSAPTRPDPTSR